MIFTDVLRYTVFKTELNGQKTNSLVEHGDNSSNNNIFNHELSPFLFTWLTVSNLEHIVTQMMCVDASSA